MRKIIVLTFLTLDGVMQAPGGPEEDLSDGFKYGGWQFPFADESTGKLMAKQMDHPFDLLLGRKTYNIFANYWPHQDEMTSPVAEKFNKAKKYVASHSPLTPEWNNSVLLKGDIVSDLKKIKEADGPELQVHGSSNLVQTLLKNSLVDELWLKIFPVTLGSGKRLFADGTIPCTFQLIEGTITPNGVIFANYKPVGEVKTGTF